VEFRGLHHLKQSHSQGAGILLAGNHCRWSDPFVAAVLGIHVRRYFYYLASYHTFKQSRFEAWLSNRLGGFSILREGADRQALRACVDILTRAERPIVVYPEGTWFRMNDRLGPLQDGVGLIARQAARAGKRPIVLHPIAMKYWCKDDPRPELDARLRRLEAVLSWPAQDHLDSISRIDKLAGGLLAVKEAHYLGRPPQGPLGQRIAGLVDSVVGSLEERHGAKRTDDLPLKRIRRLRQLLVKRLLEVAAQPSEEDAIRQALDDLLFCENINSYSLDYLRELPSWERLTEAVLRIEETAFDRVKESVVPMGVVAEIGPALRVEDFLSPRGAARAELGGGDPLMVELARRLQAQLNGLLAQGPPARWGFPPVSEQEFALRRAMSPGMDGQPKVNGVLAER
jgi:hypothetical protein